MALSGCHKERRGYLICDESTAAENQDQRTRQGSHAMLSPRILFQDERIAVVDKPAGVSVLGDRSGAPDLWQALPDLLGAQPLLVHRLDKPTSGVMVFALDRDAQRALTRAFHQRTVRKYYLARVKGDPGTAGTIDLPLKKGRKNRYRVAGLRTDIVQDERGWHLPEAGEDGHPSLTRFRRLAPRDDGANSLLMLAPRTGRTHQLRVHLAWIGHPIMGDTVYGRPKDPEQAAPRLLLHSHRLVLPGFGSYASRPGPDWGSE
jgi:tRNA pseudouridine32 synthase/23S rRNA pseudouridine746 synthase/23S rRNA pseudouridine1911/1915/1917 synthase